MKLAKGLKEKNKKAKNVNTLISRMVENNSRVKGAKSNYDSKALYKEVLTELDQYIEFKTKLFTASVAIREKIFRIGELRSLIRQLSGMSAYEGVVKSHYESTTVEYECTINQVEKDTLIKSLETEIDTLQDEIDAFNATKEI